MRSQFLVCKERLLTAKTHQNFVRIDKYLCDLLSKQIFRRLTNLKLLHGNEINNGTLEKRRSFQ